MSYREITVCLERAESAKSLALVASKLGAGLHAHVNGVHALPHMEINAAVSPYVPQSVMEQIQQKAKENAEEIKSSFSSIMSQSDTLWQWVLRECRYASDYEPYLDYALYSDIVVSTQPLAGMEESDLHRALLTKVGTPVVIVPHEQQTDAFGERIMVAWNATSEAARSVRNALPLLCSAAEVQVVTVGTQHKHDDNSQTRKLTLEQYLEKHNVISTHHDLPDKRLGVSVNLLEHAKANDIDLLVMGGFGHSRLYDVVVGAATGDTLRRMHIPVFLSH